jgi:hypothetical protein
MDVLAAETGPLLTQGSVQFILFGVMVVAVFITLWFTISK